MNLSKSKYCTGMQCPKILWMDKNMPNQKAEQDTTHMKRGLKIGELARDYFGEYTEMHFDGENFGEMISETKRLIEAGTKVIAEATFCIDGNFCRVDILRKSDDGYEIIEVKSSTDKGVTPEEIRQTFLDDMAYQYYVLKNSGIQVSKISLMQLNSQYVRHGELDLQKLFVILDCTAVVMNMQDKVSDNIARIRATAMQEEEPDIRIGSWCKSCLYASWCLRSLPENNIFDIRWGLHDSTKDTAYQSGYVTFEEVLASDVKLNKKQMRQVETVVNNLPPHIESDNIRQFLDSLSYPLYHLDFETFGQPVPLWDGVKPYNPIPFQYSLHIQKSPGAKPIHKEYLAKEGVDPRREVAERLCSDIPKDVCVLAYSIGYEKMCIRGLANTFPDLFEHLMNIHDNFIDLKIPFSKGYYYNRDMGGSASIKEVLPALLGYDPYDELTFVKGGSDAMTLFPILHEKPPEEIEKIRKALLAYCKLDTQAMVWVLDKLYEMT